MRQTSRAEIARKPPESMGVVDAAVAAELARGFDVVICGHVHAPAQRAIPGAPADSELIVLGPWDEHGGWYAGHEGSGLELRAYRD
jgi:UDP-2,3-diacylglucosamine pyrophosphatase LpxH